MASQEEGKPTGNTQYNQIFDIYSKLYPPSGETQDDYPMSAIEEHQLYLALTHPTIDIKGKRILDLAAGNGHSSNKYLSWKAESVTAVDVSDAMIDLGRQHAKSHGISESRLRFIRGDVTDPNQMIPGAPFDIVTSCWLLNYASDRTVMTRMWNFIGRHLKPGGVFVGMTIPPLLTDQPWEGQMLDLVYSPIGAWGRHGNRGKVLEAMPNGDGYKVRTELHLAAEEEVASFENYHLSLRVFEESCQASAMFTGLEWRDFVVPEETRMKFPVGYWNSLSLSPHCRICVARRVT